MWLQVLTVATLALITYEDFRYRLVRVVLYVLIFGFLFIQQFNKIVLGQLLVNWSFNVVYLILLISLCGLYLFVRNRTIKIWNYIGIGDLLFLMAIASWFEPVEFVVFNSVSLIVTLLLHGMLRKTPLYFQFDTIPMAGMQSLCFIPTFIYMS